MRLLRAESYGDVRERSRHHFAALTTGSTVQSRASPRSAY